MERGYDSQTEFWRELTDEEIRQLTQQGNTAENWKFVSVLRSFSCQDIWNCHFSGPVKIGEDVKLRNVSEISGYELRYATIINVPTLVYCDWYNVLDNDTDLPHVKGTHIRITRRSGEMEHHFTILREFRSLDKTYSPFEYPRLDLCIEDGSLQVFVTPEMTTAHVYAALYTEKPNLFCPMSTPTEYAKMGYISGTVVNVGTITGSIIQGGSLHGCPELRGCWIDGGVIGTGVRLNRVIVQKGATVKSGSDVSDSLICRESKIGDNARIYHSVVGDFSEIFGGEVGHSFLYPCHRQHHSSSVVMASHLQGLSDIAACTVLGTTPADQTNDCGLEAGKGLRIGPHTTLARPSSFAPFTILASGDYPHPLKIPFAFSLVRNNVKDDCLEVTPAYWWMNNTYALAKSQLQACGRREDFWWLTRTPNAESLSHIFEFESMRLFSSDVIQCILENHQMLSRYVAGKSRLPAMELSKRQVRVIQPDAALKCYRDMLLLYLYGESIQHYGENAQQWKVFVAGEKGVEQTELISFIKQAKLTTFLNAGGFPLTHSDLKKLCENGTGCWQDFNYCEKLISTAGTGKPHLHYVLKYLCGNEVTEEKIKSLFKEAEMVQKHFAGRVQLEKAEDLDSPFYQTNDIFIDYKTTNSMYDKTNKRVQNILENDEVCVFAKTGRYEYGKASGYIKKYL